MIQIAEMQTLLLAVAVLPAVAAGLTQVAKKLDQKLQTKVLYQKAVAPALWVQWQLSHKLTSLTQLRSWQVTAVLAVGSANPSSQYGARTEKVPVD